MCLRHAWAGQDQRLARHGAHVGGTDDEDAVVLAEAVHLAEQLQQALLALRRAAVAAAQAPRLPDRVHLICTVLSRCPQNTYVCLITTQDRIDAVRTMACMQQAAKRQQNEEPGRQSSTGIHIAGAKACCRGAVADRR